jgi:predicted Rdx family selenoprotein
MGGVFEVVVDGELISSKKASGRHEELDVVLMSVRGRARS